MSLEAILTVVTVVLAVIALIPKERGQDLLVRLGGSAAALTILAACLVLYWGLLEPLHSLPGIRRLPRFIPWLYGWDPASSSLAAFLAATGYAWWIYARQVPVGRLPMLAKALSDALARRRFAECAHLLEAHLETIRRGLEGSYWRVRLRKRFFPTPGELHLKAISAPGPSLPDVPEGAEDGEDDAEEHAIPQLPDLRALPKAKEQSRLVRTLTAWAERPADAANEIVRSVSLAPELVRHIATANPYLGHSLTMLPSTWLVREFAESFAEALVTDPESVLYRELRRATNVDRHNVPIVERSEQRLLADLCDEAVGPDSPRLLYTYLEAGVDTVRGHSSHSLQHDLSGPIGDYYERGRWSSPPFSTIYLLEVTAPRNAVATEGQNINLYVLSSLTDALLLQLSPTEDVDLHREWPTPTHYLLYGCVSLLVDIIAIWRDRPEELPENKLAAIDDEGLPHILSAHAIDVLGSVMHAVLRTRKLDAHFKRYLLEAWWRAYWPKYGEAWSHTDTILSRLVAGGRYGAGDMAHRDGLAEALDRVDPLRRNMEGGDRIRAAFGLEEG